MAEDHEFVAQFRLARGDPRDELVGAHLQEQPGLGLPGVRRMMDEFAIESGPGRGTRITARKWVRRRVEL